MRMEWLEEGALWQKGPRTIQKRDLEAIRKIRDIQAMDTSNLDNN